MHYRLTEVISNKAKGKKIKEQNVFVVGQTE